MYVSTQWSWDSWECFFLFVFFSLSLGDENLGLFALCRYFTNFSCLPFPLGQSNFQFFSHRLLLLLKALLCVSCWLYVAWPLVLQHGSSYIYFFQSDIYICNLCMADYRTVPPMPCMYYLCIVCVLSLLSDLCALHCLHPTVMTSTSQEVLRRNTKDVHPFFIYSLYSLCIYLSTVLADLFQLPGCRFTGA